MSDEEDPQSRSLDLAPGCSPIRAHQQDIAVDIEALRHLGSLQTPQICNANLGNVLSDGQVGIEQSRAFTSLHTIRLYAED